MEQETSVHLMEEDKFGWTIVSTKHHDQHDEVEEPLARELEDSTKDVEGADSTKGVGGDVLDCNTQGIAQSGQGKKEAHKQEDSEGGHVICDKEDEEEHKDGYNGDDDAEREELKREGEEEEEEEEVAALKGCTSPTKCFPWEAKEANPLLGSKQTLVHQETQKHSGLLWRVSLVATLGFFGWVVLNGLSGGMGKNFRCLKLHPCNIKEGEVVLNPI